MADRSDYGWCENRTAHGVYDHARQPDCINFVSDDEMTARLTAEAAAADRKTIHVWPSGATSQAAAYVAEHRPY